MFTVSCQLTVRRALPRPPNKLFFYLQVSQSGYANLINGHASLLSPRGGGGGGGVSQENQDDPFPKNTREPYNYNSVLFDLKSNCTI